MRGDTSTWRPRDRCFTFDRADHNQFDPIRTPSFKNDSIISPSNSKYIHSQHFLPFSCGRPASSVTLGCTTRVFVPARRYITCHLSLAAPSFGLVEESTTEARRNRHLHGTPSNAIHFIGCAGVASVALDFVFSRTTLCPAGINMPSVPTHL